jgi:hypothetical protein
MRGVAYVGARALRDATDKAGALVETQRAISELYQRTVVRPLPGLSAKGAADFAVPVRDADSVAGAAKLPSASALGRGARLRQQARQESRPDTKDVPQFVSVEPTRGGVSKRTGPIAPGGPR